jgi:hypothetical protein
LLKWLELDSRNAERSTKAGEKVSTGGFLPLGSYGIGS